MATVQLSLALVDDCDRTVEIVDGSIRPQGVDFLVTTAAPPELFRRVVQFAEFDVSEMSMSSFIALLSREDDRYVGLPIFPRRTFRHSFIFVHADSGIERPADLEGRLVGVSEYQQTASLWIRGILKDEYEVSSERIQWLEGGLDTPNQLERLPLQLPETIDIKPIGAGKTLSDMLREGELDALISPRRPRCFIEGDPRVKRLIPNYREVEQDYFRRTGYFPIMHMMVIRRTVLDAHPWLAQNLLHAFEQAKRAADRRLRAMAERSGGLPWLLNDVEELRGVFGNKDHWPYGIRENQHTLEKTLEMSYEQGLALRKLEVEELFAEQVREGTKIEFA